MVAIAKFHVDCDESLEPRSDLLFQILAAGPRPSSLSSGDQGNFVSLILVSKDRVVFWRWVQVRTTIPC